MFEKVLITGGAGFIGSAIADQLITVNSVREVACLDNMVRGRRENLATAIESGRVRLVEGDMRDRTLLESLIEGCDLVYHQAALRITQCAAEPRHALEVMVDGTFDLLELCVKHKVKRVVAASTASVYGAAARFPTDEDCPPYPNRTLYGAAKAFNEGLLRSFNDMYGLDYVALRYFNAYGPRMDIHGAYTEVLVRWMDRIVAGQAPLIFGDGRQTMDFVYVDDIARANILAATAPVTDSVFNVASGTETSLLGLASALLEVMGSTAKPEHLPERKINPVPRRLADTRAAREKLGFEAKVDLRTGLKRLVEWWRSEKRRSER
jgi:UDP-glucose 4-epimerase